MSGFPHEYPVTATAAARGSVTVSAEGMPTLASAPPKQFGGPGDQWSPEDLLVASVADCFILTFRAIARASKLEWEDLECRVNGILDRVDGQLRFTRMDVRAALKVPRGTELARAEKLLQKAEHGCLVTNSLNSEATLETSITET